MIPSTPPSLEERFSPIRSAERAAEHIGSVLPISSSRDDWAAAPEAVLRREILTLSPAEAGKVPAVRDAFSPLSSGRTATPVSIHTRTRLPVRQRALLDEVAHPVDEPQAVVADLAGRGSARPANGSVRRPASIPGRRARRRSPRSSASPLRRRGGCCGGQLVDRQHEILAPLRRQARALRTPCDGRPHRGRPAGMIGIDWASAGGWGSGRCARRTGERARRRRLSRERLTRGRMTLGCRCSCSAWLEAACFESEAIGPAARGGPPRYDRGRCSLCVISRYPAVVRRMRAAGPKVSRRACRASPRLLSVWCGSRRSSMLRRYPAPTKRRGVRGDRSGGPLGRARSGRAGSRRAFCLRELAEGRAAVAFHPDRVDHGPRP